MSANQLYYGDNLDILYRYIKNDSVDLIYLDPPFNSNRDYNVIFAEQNGTRSKAQIKAFEDTWRWDQGAAEEYEHIVENIGGPIAQVMQAFRTFLGGNDMLAYLTRMAPRLVELRRVLKPGGSIYLHCDPTASHYLKMLMDAAFSPTWFQNEIVWHYRGGGVSKSRFGRRHDILLLYSKGQKPITFNVDAVRTPYSQESLERLQYKARAFRGQKIYDTYEPNPLGKHPDDVWDIQPIMPSSKERLGYPTQKPERLLEFVIKASSRKGDIVLDPFCGCGTTVAVAEALERHWIGIDITHLAITAIKHRFAIRQAVPVEFEVIGEPVSLPDAVKLAEEDRFQFQWWALGLVGARPTEQKKGADKGIDGRLYFHDYPKGPTKQVILSVKSGKVSVKDVRELRGTVIREKAMIGVLITLQKPTKPMRTEAASFGFYESPWNTKHPRLQILTVDQLLKGAKIDLPGRDETNITYKRAINNNKK
jgi:site-specific DNA-methyltransferase (adenine-specific)